MSSFFKALTKPDHDDDPEKAVIVAAANLLQIGEFQLLQLAYKDWFGEELSPADVDGLFTRYMLHDEITPWMRHFARKILAAHESGDIDIDAAQWHRYDSVYTTQVPNGVRRFVGACLVLATLVFGSLWISGHAAGLHGSLFPPYFEADEKSKE